MDITTEQLFHLRKFAYQGDEFHNTMMDSSVIILFKYLGKKDYRDDKKSIKSVSDSSGRMQGMPDIWIRQTKYRNLNDKCFFYLFAD